MSEEGAHPAPTMVDGVWTGRVTVPWVLVSGGDSAVVDVASRGLLDDARADIAAAGMVVDDTSDRPATLYLETERFETRDRVLRLEVPYRAEGTVTHLVNHRVDG